MYESVFISLHMHHMCAMSMGEQMRALDAWELGSQVLRVI